MSNITIVVFTYNEEKRIAYIMRNFRNFGPIVVFDDGSTDRTKAIVEEMGGTYVLRPKNPDWAADGKETHDFIKSHINTDWIFRVFADFVAPKRLLAELAKISEENKYKMVQVPMYNYLWGDANFIVKSHCPLFYHKDYMDFSNNFTHGMGQFTGRKDEFIKLPIKKEYALRHFSEYNLNKFVTKHLRYAEVEAKEKFVAGQKKYSVVRLMAAMLRYLWIYRRGLKNGGAGLISVLSNVFWRFMTYASLYELENGLTLEKIAAQYNVEKEKLLKEFD